MVIAKYGHRLDIRTHKKDWLSIDSLTRMQHKQRQLCDTILTHPRRIEVTQCYVCQSAAASDFGTTYGIPYRECNKCSHVYARFTLQEADLLAYYETAYFKKSVYLDKEQVASRNIGLLQPKVRFVGEFVKTMRNRWLDVGAGNGGVVACAKEMGFDAYGLEPSSDGVTFAQEMFNLPLKQHTIEKELQVSGTGSYDIVSFFMVLEHVRNPVEQVCAARKLLSDNGIVVIEVPKADSMAAYADVLYQDQPLRQLVGSHIMNYTTKSARYLVEHNGFAVEGLWFMGQDIANLIFHMALHTPTLLDSRFYKMLLDYNNEFQEVVDRAELCDEVIVVARKLPATIG